MQSKSLVSKDLWSFTRSDSRNHPELIQAGRTDADALGTDGQDRKINKVKENPEEKKSPVSAMCLSFS